KLMREFFPKIFGAQQNLPLDSDAVRKAFAELAREIGDGRSAEDVADGFIKIAVENMANAIKKISVQRGYDVTRYALNCFGGAGAQHACLIADALGMKSVLIHPLAGVLSAYGMGLADIRSHRHQAIEEILDAKLLGKLKRFTCATPAPIRASSSTSPVYQLCGKLLRRRTGTNMASLHPRSSSSSRLCRSRASAAVRISASARTRKRGASPSLAARRGFI